jgi:tetratricopeptide (TPR) repeat protein
MIDLERIASARQALGRQLAALRQAAGLNQADLAARIVGYGRSTVANVEIGRQNVRRDFWQRCDRVLGTQDLVPGYDQIQVLVRRRREEAAQAMRAERTRHTAGETAGADGGANGGFSAAAADRAPAAPAWEPAHTAEDVDRFTAGDLMLGRREANRVLAALLVGAALTEPLEQWVRAGAHIVEPGRRGTLGEDEVAHIEAFTRALRHWDNRFRLGVRRKAVVGQLNEVADLIKGGQEPAIAQRLFVVLAELAKIAGSMAFDAGLHPTAQRYYLFALRASHRAGDRLLGANILADMARQLLDLNYPYDALELIRLALDAVQREAPGRVLAMLRTREAWAYAAMGRVQAFHRAAAVAQECFAQPTGDVPYWLRHFDEAELAGVIGARMRDVAGRAALAGSAGVAGADRAVAERAVGHIQRAIALRHPRRVRNRAFDLIGLGRTYLLLGEPEEACRVVASALPLATETGSGRVRKRLSDFHEESSGFTKIRTVATIRTEIRHRLNAAGG